MAIKKIKDKAWAVFSKYIRLRDTNKLGTECFTCRKYGDWKKMDAGHYLPGRYKSILFDERMVHAQCKQCNQLHGNWPEYDKRMKQEYGEEEVEKMKNQYKRFIGKWTEDELEKIHLKYKAKLKNYITI